MGRPRNPILILPSELMYVQIEKHRENRHVPQVGRNIIYGDPERIQDIIEETGRTINTSFVERGNLTTRTWNNRFTRRGIGFSKDDEYLECSLDLLKVRMNFIRFHPSLRKRKPGRPHKRDGPYTHQTPAMAAGITDHPWTWHKFLHHRKHT